jgi:spore germination protein YaaH
MILSCTTKPAPELSAGIPEDAAPADEEAAIEEEPIVLPKGFENLPVSAFRESWAYLETGSEADLKADYPITDIGYFAASVSSYGRLIEIPRRQNLSKFKGRVHLVAVCWGAALTHFALEPGSATRRQLIADLLRASADFDGLQIDYENVLPGDTDAFLSFLKELRAGLGKKMLSVALQARVKTLQNDPEDYARIAPLVDRIIVMAYDEHWASGAPGPVASMNWCRSVARYSLQTVGADKIVMGVPFYGRTWGSEQTNRAYFQVGIDRIKREQGITEVRRANGVPYFTYTLPVTVTAYYDDEYSIASRLDMYASLGVKSVGFWKLGQEKPAVWKLLRLSQ